MHIKLRASKVTALMVEEGLIFYGQVKGWLLLLTRGHPDVSWVVQRYTELLFEWHADVLLVDCVGGVAWV